MLAPHAASTSSAAALLHFYCCCADRSNAIQDQAIAHALITARREHIFALAAELRCKYELSGVTEVVLREQYRSREGPKKKDRYVPETDMLCRTVSTAIARTV
jgi:hypothetical protein